MRQAALRATLDALADDGLGAVTMAEVARRAGVHASSLIRRWGTVEAMALDALLAFSLDRLPVPDTGGLREDLTLFAEGLVRYLHSSQGSALARMMVTVDDDAQISSSRGSFWGARLAEARVMVDRAIDRGEVPTGTDPGVVLETLIAPLHFRHLLTRRALDSEVIASTVDIVLHGICARHMGASGSDRFEQC